MLDAGSERKKPSNIKHPTTNIGPHGPGKTTSWRAYFYPKDYAEATLGKPAYIGLGTEAIQILFAAIALVWGFSALGWPRLGGVAAVVLACATWLVPERSTAITVTQNLGLPGIDFSLSLGTQQRHYLQVLCTVYAAVHAYSLFYPGLPKATDFQFSIFRFQFRKGYFSTLGLFLLGMATLMLAASPIAILVGWETIGLASYVLLNTYRDQFATGAQASWVFWINRIGDMALLAGVCLMLVLPGDASYKSGLLTWCIVLAVCVKSIQLPFSVWLPWAMVGPMPVSALLHAATLVVGGVVLSQNPLILNNILYLDPAAMEGRGAALLLSLLSLITLFWAAWRALRANHLKQLLAYSTISQVAFMLLGWESGGAGYHLYTHAFFKALLFLSLGLLHHYEVTEPLPVRELWARLRQNPICMVTALVALLGLASMNGLPLFGGHESKAIILGGIVSRMYGWDALVVYLLIGAYLLLLAGYSVRFFYHLCQQLVLHLPTHRGAWGQVAVFAGLVPFLFVHMPYKGHPLASEWLITVASGLALLAAVLAHRWVLAPAPTQDSVSKWAALAVGNSLAQLANRIQTIDRLRLAHVPVFLAEAVVVIAWLLAFMERGALNLIRAMLGLVVVPLRGLVDDQGQIKTGRALWLVGVVGVAVALLI